MSERKALEHISEKYHGFDFGKWGSDGLRAAEACIREMGKIADSCILESQDKQNNKTVPQMLVDYCINLALSYHNGEIELDEAQDFIRGAIKEML